MVMKTKVENAFLAPRRGFSCIKKGMFSDVEGHVLECRKAWTGLERDENSLQIWCDGLMSRG